jgi:hypothetical protein
MTDQERNQILKMIEEGKITPEEGLKLMQTLDMTAVDDNAAPEIPPAAQAEAGTGSGPESGEAETGTKAEKSGIEVDPRINRVKSTARRLWQIPLWIGVIVTILSAWGMYTLVAAAHLNFWFFCLIAPLLLGVLVIVAAVGSRKAHWIFVDVHQKPGEKPARIFLGFPLPLKFIAGLMRVLKQWFPGLARELDEDKDGPGMEGVIKIMELVETGFTGEEPLVVNVDEGDDGERVQVYIG